MASSLLLELGVDEALGACGLHEASMEREAGLRGAAGDFASHARALHGAFPAYDTGWIGQGS